MEDRALWLLLEIYCNISLEHAILTYDSESIYALIDLELFCIIPAGGGGQEKL